MDIRNTREGRCAEEKEIEMRKSAWLMVAALAVTFAWGARAEEVAGLPLHVKRLNAGAVRVWLGDYVSTTAQVAFATSKGIVVVDTFGDPKIDVPLRAVIARELGRSDFTMLINTHEHGDHTGGNSVYSDCTIVGHELVVEAMNAPEGNNREWIEWVTNSISEDERKLETMKAGSAEAKQLSETLVSRRINLANIQSPARRVPPTKTFSDRLTLDMGDTTFVLYYIGGMHSASDAAILVPEQGLLLTGDTMADVWLTDTPGCLASFMARAGVRHDFPLMLANWDRILAQKDRIKLLLPAHWNGELSMQGAQARVNYVRALWDGANGAVKDGKGIANVFTDYALATRFPELASSPGCSPLNHGSTIGEMWKIAANQESAAQRLYALIDEGAPESAVREVMAEREKKIAKYYFVENEVNALAYRLLQENKLPKAIALFKLNVTLFPDAWNVYDSLGEALLKSGDAAGAAKMYEKSLALNPESKSGKDALANIGAANAKT